MGIESKMNKLKEISPRPVSLIRAFFEIDELGKKQSLSIGKDRVVIGGVESADIRLSGLKVSPIHAILEIDWAKEPSRCSARLIDLASFSGVTVNGMPIVNETINPGDLVQIGDAVIRFGFRLPDQREILPDRSLLLIDPATVTPIFDYRPTTKEALEVVCSWNGVILNVKNFLDETAVQLGRKSDADFQIPKGFFGSNEERLAVRQGRVWHLTLVPEMKGVLYREGKLIAISEFLKQKGSETQTRVSMGESDFVKLQIGPLSFHLSKTVAPPHLVKRGDLGSDPFFTRMLLVSLSITILTLFGVSRLEVVPTEPPAVSETVATILYHPEKYSIKRPPAPESVSQPEPAREPIPAKESRGKQVVEVKSKEPGKRLSAESVGKEGEGARAKGLQGTRGSRNKAASEIKKTAANRSSPSAGQGRGGTKSQAQAEGNAQLLKGSSNKILDLLGGSGQKLGAPGTKLEGFGGFSNRGNGGMALQGSGKGGGGNADSLLSGLSDQHRGGAKVGTGLGAEGTGTGIVGGKTRVDLNSGGGNETVVIGSIDRDAIDAAIRAHRDEFQYCYEHEVNSGHPALAGKIVSAFVIGGSGRASQMAVASSSIGSANVEKCVLGVIARIQFPLPGGGVPVSIKYRFAFTNASR
jgi:hypothetical protein